jgi:hypothetical protein
MCTSAGRSTAALALVALVLAACGSASTAPPSTSSLYRRLVAAYVTYAACARTHGMPDLPDPEVDAEGNDHYPQLDRRGSWRWPAGVLSGCAAVWAHVHAVRDAYDSAIGARSAASSPSEYRRGLALARCIRAHGFPTFPDPTSGGGIVVGSVPPGFQKPNLSAQARAALAACSRDTKR